MQEGTSLSILFTELRLGYLVWGPLYVSFSSLIFFLT